MTEIKNCAKIDENGSFRYVQLGSCLNRRFVLEQSNPIELKPQIMGSGICIDNVAYRVVSAVYDKGYFHLLLQNTETSELHGASFNAAFGKLSLASKGA